MNELALFAGAGGGILGTKLLGWQVVCAVEILPYAREVLLRRQEEGIIEPFPIWDNIKTFDGKPWRGKVDVITAGFPCQPWSVAGKQKGEADKRNLWPETSRVIQEVKPRYILLENVPGIQPYLPVVIRDLRRAGYTVKRPVELGACDVGAPHRRNRIWIMAYTNNTGSRASRDGDNRDGQTKDKEWEEQSQHRVGRCGEVANPKQSPAWSSYRQGSDRRRSDNQQDNGNCMGHDARNGSQDVANSDTERLQNRQGFEAFPNKREAINRGGRQWWKSEPELGRVAHGVAYRVDRLKALGEGQVPAVVRVAWELLGRI